LSSILYWGVQGAMKWYSLGSSGLQTPTYIADTTKSQRDSQDFVQQWLDECCEEDTESWTANEVIIASYAHWCESNNVTSKKAKALAQSLQMKGFKTGVVKRVGVRTQKGVNGLKIPVSLWDAEETSDKNVTDALRVTDVTPKPENLSGIPIGRLSGTPVTSVTSFQSVTLTKKETENQGENTESGASIELCGNCLDRGTETPGTCELGEIMYCEKCDEERSSQ